MKLRKTDFQGGKYALIMIMMKYLEMESITECKDISVNPAERPLLTLQVLQNIIYPELFISKTKTMQSMAR
jgi:hypothetical protein